MRSLREQTPRDRGVGTRNDVVRGSASKAGPPIGTDDAAQKPGRAKEFTVSAIPSSPTLANRGEDHAPVGAQMSGQRAGPRP
jgi:hypothetical protein